MDRPETTARPPTGGPGDRAGSERRRPVYRFGPFRLDPRGPELFHGAEPVPLTPKALDTLAVLLERRGRVVSRRRLLRRVWPEAFVEEGVLTQNIYTLRKALGELDPEGRYIETIPRRGYRFLAEVVEELPEGARAPAAASGRPRLALAGLAAVLAVAAVALLLGRDRPARPEIDSLAVLPFVPLAAGQENEALGLGMADALIGRLSALEGVSVRPTSAVRTLVGADRDLDRLAEGLGVDAILDGTIQRAGERVRLSVQLVTGERAAPVWADRFDTVFTDIFGVQDAIASRVAAALSRELRGGSADGPARELPDSAAYEAYLNGRYLWNRRAGRSLEQAIASFEEAIAIDPEYARAWAGLADAWVLLPLYGEVQPREAFPRALAAAATALSLEPGLAGAHTALAYSRFLYEWDWAGSERAFRRALEIEPGYATAHHWYAYLLASRGRHAEAVREMELALALDPLSPILWADAGLVLYWAGRPSAAAERLRHALELEPGFAYAHFGLGLALEALDGAAAGVEATRRAVELSGESSAMLGALARIEGAAGNAEGARRIVDRLLERGEAGGVQAGHVAMALTGLGDGARTIEWWGRAVEERSRFAPFFEVWPIFDPLRSDPRFARLVARVGGDGTAADG